MMALTIFQCQCNPTKGRNRQMADGTKRSDIQIGMTVNIVQKENQQNGQLTEGTVKKILTNSPVHHHGIKVMLESGFVGRVKEIRK
jgi:uncharacterized repeat protein (TIGR03833 family)